MLDQVHYLQKSNRHIKALACYEKFKLYPRDPSLQQYVDQLATSLIVKRGVVYVMHQGKPLALVPQDLKASILHHSHDSPSAGHWSSTGTLDEILQSWHWPDIEKKVELHC